MDNFLINLFVIALLTVSVVVVPSLATSFVLWDWQWFWETNTGWRVFVLLLITGVSAH